MSLTWISNLAFVGPQKMVNKLLKDYPRRNQRGPSQWSSRNQKAAVGLLEGYMDAAWSMNWNIAKP
jgi:hypothetical protein